jgi:putative ABC transport system ATP-binding protein
MTLATLAADIRVQKGDSLGSMISLRNVSKIYRGAHSANEVSVLTDFDLDADVGEFVALMGPSGSGKTTLLNLIGGLDTPSSGEVIVADTHLEALSSRELATWRARHVGFVFQSHNLIRILSAEENVELPLLLKSLPHKERARLTQEALRQVGLLQRAAHRPGALSGGQQQRVGIARAIVSDPPILLLEEPTGNLDRSTAEDILTLLRLLQSSGRTVVMVTHDPEAARAATRTVHLGAV